MLIIADMHLALSFDVQDSRVEDNSESNLIARYSCLLRVQNTSQSLNLCNSVKVIDAGATAQTTGRAAFPQVLDTGPWFMQGHASSSFKLDWTCRRMKILILA